MKRPTDGVTYSRLVVDALSRGGDREAFVGPDGGSWSYRRSADLCGRLRRVLTDLGVGPGTGVGTLGSNRPDLWLAQAATFLCGARFTGLHPLGSEDDQVFMADDAELEVLVVDPVYAERAAAIARRSSTVKHVLTLGPAPAGDDLLAMCERAGPAAELDAGPAGEEDIAWISYTGGTTGVPKGVMLSHRALVQMTQSVLASWGFPQEPRYLAASPITHAAAVPILPTLLRGGTTVLHRRFDPEAWLRTVQEQRISYALAVPTMIYAILDSGHAARSDLSSLRTLVYGAAPMSPARLTEAHDTIGRVFLQAYGQTECMGIATILARHEHDPEHRPELLASCGRAAVGAEVAVLGDDAHEVAVGEIGEIGVRGRSVMSGYWKNPQQTEAVLRQGWLRTGDMAQRDGDGYLYIVDRKKDMIISGGFNVYPREVEDVLTSDPDVAIAAVIGVPDDKWGEAVTAVVVPRPGCNVDPARLIDLVRQRKGPHQAPKSVEITDTVPLTPVGKVDKKLLRSRFKDQAPATSRGSTRKEHA